MLKTQLAAFAGAIRDWDAPPPPDLIGAISVHRNNHRILLTDALAETFSTLAALVGRDWFDQAARRFIAASPPQAAHLSVYGEAFPGFLAELPAESQCPPWAADAARFDWAWTGCWSADDAPIVTPADAGALVAGHLADSLADHCFTPHPAARLIASRWPLTALHRLAQPGANAAARVNLDAGGEYLLLTRPDLEVEMQNVTRGAYAFFTALAENQSLGAAAGIATEAEANFDLAATLAIGLRAGAWTP